MPERTSDAVLAEPPDRKNRASQARWTAIAILAAAIAFGALPAAAGWQWLEGSPVALVHAAEPAARKDGERFAIGAPTAAEASMDRVLDEFLASGFEAGNTPFMERLVPCGALPWANLPTLACALDEPLGTRHSLVLSACQSQWTTPDDANAELRLQFAEGPGAARRLRTGDDFSASITWAAQPERSLVLVVTSGGVTSFRANCDVPVSAVARR